MNDRDALPAVRLIAAQAEKLAEDLARGKLWPGDMVAQLDQISKALADAYRHAERR